MINRVWQIHKIRPSPWCETTTAQPPYPLKLRCTKFSACRRLQRMNCLWAFTLDGWKGWPAISLRKRPPVVQQIMTRRGCATIHVQRSNRSRNFFVAKMIFPALLLQWTGMRLAVTQLFISWCSWKFTRAKMKGALETARTTLLTAAATPVLLQAQFSILQQSQNDLQRGQSERLLGRALWHITIPVRDQCHWRVSSFNLYVTMAAQLQGGTGLQ
jgi:hypothetical protein